MFEGFLEQFTKLLSKPIEKKENGVPLKKVEQGWLVKSEYPKTRLIISEDRLEKGKGAQVGEVREWKGQKYKKDTSGKWVLVVEGKNGSQGEEKPDISKLSEEEVSKYSRSAKTESLKRHAEGGDEKMRLAAKAELARREKEENPEEGNLALKEINSATLKKINSQYHEKYKTLSAREINSGYCDLWADSFVEKLGGEVLEIPLPDSKNSSTHYFVKKDGLYYDAEKPEGVKNPKELPYFTRAKEHLGKDFPEENFNEYSGSEAKGEGSKDSLEKTKENEEKGSEQTVDSKEEKLNSDYRKVVEEMMNPDIFSKPEELKTLSTKQKETARYLKRIGDFKGVDQEQAKTEILKKLDLTTDTELQEFVGDGKILAMKKSFGELSFLTEDCYCQLNVGGGDIAHLSEFILDVNLEKGKGKGTEIFSKQLTHLKEKGYKSIELIAAKSETYNGYYTWAVLGFEVNFNSKQFRDLLQKSDNSRVKGCKKLTELMSFKEGAEFWRENGYQFDAKFDLKENSNSMKLFKNYMDRKK